MTNVAPKSRPRLSSRRDAVLREMGLGPIWRLRAPRANAHDVHADDQAHLGFDVWKRNHPKLDARQQIQPANNAVCTITESTPVHTFQLVLFDYGHLVTLKGSTTSASIGIQKADLGQYTVHRSSPK